MSGNSYQKNGGVGVYHEIPNAEDGIVNRKNKKFWIGVIVVVAVGVLGIVYKTTVLKPAGAAVADLTKKAADSGELQIKSNGQLKLFDKKSKFCKMEFSHCIYFPF